MNVDEGQMTDVNHVIEQDDKNKLRLQCDV